MGSQGRAPHTKSRAVKMPDGTWHVVESVTLTTGQRLGRWAASNLVNAAIIGGVVIALAGPTIRREVAIYGDPHMKAAEAEHHELRSEIAVTNARVDTVETKERDDAARIVVLEREHDDKMVYLRDSAGKLQQVLDGQATLIRQNEIQDKRLDNIEQALSGRKPMRLPAAPKVQPPLLAAWKLVDRGAPEPR